jgi:O-antigen ligase
VKARDDAWREAAAWALAGAPFLTVGIAYTVWLAAVLGCAIALRERRDGAAFWRQPTAAPAVALMAWLALSALWSPAPPAIKASHLGIYSLVLALPLLGAALPVPLARSALRRFVVAAGLVATLLLLDHADALPPSPLWRTTIDAEGNQRIAMSMLLGLGAAIGLWHGTQACTLAERLGWLALAVLIALGLSLQSRRTGFIVLPLAMVVWALATQSSWRRRLGIVLTIALCCASIWQLSDNVRARFAEGVAEVRQYESVDTVSTSWGQRLRMIEVTAAMVRERPWSGYGIGSWQLLWQQRTAPGTMLHSHTTPHNEYLQQAHQAGVPAALMLLWLIGAAVRAALHARQKGVPSLMVWTALACVASFNVVLRDAKFALPLLILAACAAAAQRDSPHGRGSA